MDPLKVNRLSLSFLDLYEVPRDRIVGDSLAALRNPDDYYSFVSQGKDAPAQIRTKRLGGLRSGLRGDLPTDETRPRPDEFWSNLNSFYDELSGKLKKKLPCFPCIPLVLAYLPNKNRSYSMDFTKLPGSLSSSSTGKLSVSTYFFPLGYAVSRIGVYLESAAGFDPGDISVLADRPERFLWATVSGRRGKKKVLLEDDSLFSIVSGKQRSFYQAMVSFQGPVLVRSLGRYSVVDLVDVSRELDLQGDANVITQLTGSPPSGAASFENVPYQDAVNIPTPWTTLIRLPGWAQDDFRRAYRRRIRNLAMLLLIQRSLYSRVMGVSSRELIEVLRSGDLVQRLIGIFAPPKVLDSFSFLHYLTAQEPAFGNHHSVKVMYRAMRALIDEEGTIQKSTDNMVTCLNEIKEQVDKSGALASQILSTIMKALLPH